MIDTLWPAIIPDAVLFPGTHQMPWVAGNWYGAPGIIVNYDSGGAYEIECEPS